MLAQPLRTQTAPFSQKQNAVANFNNDFKIYLAFKAK